MNFRDLVQQKGIPEKHSPLDFMNRRELAANLFRINETEAKIIQQDVQGQQPLERAAFDVGRQIRNVMLANDGIRP
jgi:DNA-damage-inducible protein D